MQAGKQFTENGECSILFTENGQATGFSRPPEIITFHEEQIKQSEITEPEP